MMTKKKFLFSIFMAAFLLATFQNCGDSTRGLKDTASVGGDNGSSGPLENSLPVLKILQILDSGPRNSCIVDYEYSHTGGSVNYEVFIDGNSIGSITKEEDGGTEQLGFIDCAEVGAALDLAPDNTYKIELELQLSELEDPIKSNEVSYKLDPCRFRPAVGTVCQGGALYMGQFGGSLMVTPSGCDESQPTVCSGQIDSIRRPWFGTDGENQLIDLLESVANRAAPSSRLFSGDIATPLILASPSVKDGSPAHFCSEMEFGGYDDWYLPAKSELLYLYCLADTPAPAADFPMEAPGCSGIFGLPGKLSILPGFAIGGGAGYWSSSQSSASGVYGQSYTNGAQYVDSKRTSRHVRCIRKDLRD